MEEALLDFAEAVARGTTIQLALQHAAAAVAACAEGVPGSSKGATSRSLAAACGACLDLLAIDAGWSCHAAKAQALLAAVAGRLASAAAAMHERLQASGSNARIASVEAAELLAAALQLLRTDSDMLSDAQIAMDAADAVLSLASSNSCGATASSNGLESATTAAVTATATEAAATAVATATATAEAAATAVATAAAVESGGKRISEVGYLLNVSQEAAEQMVAALVAPGSLTLEVELVVQAADAQAAMYRCPVEPDTSSDATIAGPKPAAAHGGVVDQAGLLNVFIPHLHKMLDLLLHFTAVTSSIPAGSRYRQPASSSSLLADAGRAAAGRLLAAGVSYKLLLSLVMLTEHPRICHGLAMPRTAQVLTQLLANILAAEAPAGGGTAGRLSLMLQLLANIATCQDGFIQRLASLGMPGVLCEVMKLRLEVPVQLQTIHLLCLLCHSSACVQQLLLAAGIEAHLQALIGGGQQQAAAQQGWQPVKGSVGHQQGASSPATVITSTTSSGSSISSSCSGDSIGDGTATLAAAAAAAATQTSDLQKAAAALLSALKSCAVTGTSPSRCFCDPRLAWSLTPSHLQAAAGAPAIPRSQKTGAADLQLLRNRLAAAILDTKAGAGRALSLARCGVGTAAKNISIMPGGLLGTAVVPAATDQHVSAPGGGSLSKAQSCAPRLRAAVLLRQLPGISAALTERISPALSSRSSRPGGLLHSLRMQSRAGSTTQHGSAISLFSPFWQLGHPRATSSGTIQPLTVPRTCARSDSRPVDRFVLLSSNGGQRPASSRAARDQAGSLLLSQRPRSALAGCTGSWLPDCRQTHHTRHCDAAAADAQQRDLALPAASDAGGHSGERRFSVWGDGCSTDASNAEEWVKLCEQQ